MPRAPKAIKRPVGNPPKLIDWDIVDKGLIVGADGVHIAATLGIHPDTLYDRVEKDMGVNWSVYKQQKRAVGDQMLYNAQFKKAVSGDNTMLIWLGKNRLEQRDTPQEIAIAPETMKGMQAFLDQLAESRSALNKAESSINKYVKSE